MAALLLVFHKMISYRRLFLVITLVPLLAYVALTVGVEPPAAAMSGSIYCVATNGDDSNPGTESQPWSIRGFIKSRHSEHRR